MGASRHDSSLQVILHVSMNICHALATVLRLRTIQVTHLEPKIVCFVNQKLNLLATFENLLNVVHHDVLHLIHLQAASAEVTAGQTAVC